MDVMRCGNIHRIVRTDGGPKSKITFFVWGSVVVPEVCLLFVVLPEVYLMFCVVLYRRFTGGCCYTGGPHLL